MIARVVAVLVFSLGALAANAASCSVSATAAGFGSYDETLNDAAVATISGSCSRSAVDTDITGSTIALSTGISGSYAPRKMANGINRLNYNLYADPARTVIWGNGAAGTATVNALAVQGNGRFLNPGSTRAFSRTAYGRIPAGQSAVPGNYADTITVTITY